MSAWWKQDRSRYAVWQVQGGSRTKISGGLTRKEADRDAATVNKNLVLFKLLAPSGPQDAHAVVEPEPVSS